MQSTLFVALGGALGAACRYGLTLAAGRWVSTWPLGTWLANVLGSLALGLLFEVGAQRSWLGVDVRLVLGTGVLGGFTTYSSFNLETLRFLTQGEPARGLLYATATFVVCLAAGWLGLTLGRFLRPI